MSANGYTNRLQLTTDNSAVYSIPWSADRLTHAEKRRSRRSSVVDQMMITRRRRKTRLVRQIDRAKAIFFGFGVCFTEHVNEVVTHEITNMQARGIK